MTTLALTEKNIITLKQLTGWLLLIASGYTTYMFFEEIGMIGIKLWVITIASQALFFVAEHDVLQRKLSIFSILLTLFDIITVVGGTWIYFTTIANTSVIAMLLQVFGTFASEGTIVKISASVVGLLMALLPDYLIYGERK